MFGMWLWMKIIIKEVIKNIENVYIKLINVFFVLEIFEKGWILGLLLLLILGFEKLCCFSCFIKLFMLLIWLINFCLMCLFVVLGSVKCVGLLCFFWREVIVRDKCLILLRIFNLSGGFFKLFLLRMRRVFLFILCCFVNRFVWLLKLFFLSYKFIFLYVYLCMFFLSLMICFIVIVFNMLIIFNLCFLV